MKIRQEHVIALRNSLNELEKEIKLTKDACHYWLSIQKERETFGNVDPDSARVYRERLEHRLDRLRDRMGEIYDYMSERGLRHYG
jgi:hypothetical protein